MKQLINIIFLGLFTLGVITGCNDASVTFEDNGEGKFEGEDGDKTESEEWDNPSNRAEYEFKINATENSRATLYLRDANDEQVLKETLAGGNNGTSVSGLSSSGAAGKWTIKLKLENFDGTGSFSVSPD